MKWLSRREGKWESGQDQSDCQGVSRSLRKVRDKKLKLMKKFQEEKKLI